jgi:hypothetical protein
MAAFYKCRLGRLPRQETSPPEKHTKYNETQTTKYVRRVEILVSSLEFYLWPLRTAPVTSELPGGQRSLRGLGFWQGVDVIMEDSQEFLMLLGGRDSASEIARMCIVNSEILHPISFLRRNACRPSCSVVYFCSSVRKNRMWLHILVKPSDNSRHESLFTCFRVHTERHGEAKRQSFERFSC